MRRALIIGSNGPATLDPLRYAASDARQFREVLGGSRCGFEVVVPEDGADSYRIRQMIFDVAESCDLGDTLLCYFAGHGFLARNRLFLLLDNTRTDKLLSTALPITDVLEALRYSKADNKLLILDCCHAGAVVTNAGLRSAVGIPVEEAVTADNFLVLMASGHLERARELDALEGGFLTTRMCDALGTDFYEASAGKGQLEIDSLKRWLEDKARAHNALHRGLEVPIPFLFGQHRGPLYLTVGRDEWLPYELDWCDGGKMVILPAPPADGFAYALAKFPVTNAQYLKLLGDEGHKEPVGKHFTRNALGVNGWRGPFFPLRTPGSMEDRKPVVCVDYNDACRYVDNLNKNCARSGHYHSTHLPKEFLWDFGAFGTDEPTLRPATWLKVSSEIHHRSTSPAAYENFGPRTNAFGLVDMIGNIWEWGGVGETLVATLGRVGTDDRATHQPSVASYDSDDDDFALRQEVRGGSFLDDLRRMPIVLDVNALPERRKTRHSDLGFRIAAKVPLNVLPDEVQMRLEMLPPLEPPPDLHTPPAA